MKKLCGVLLILIVFSTTLLFPNISVVRCEAEDKSYLLKSTVKYSNPASFSQVWDFTQREDDRTISLFMNSTWQTVELVNSTFSVEREDYDEDGNAVALLQFSNSELSPGNNLSFTVWYQITAKPRTIPNISESLSDNLSDIPQSLVPAYTREEGPWQTSNPTLQQLAHNLSGSETNVLTIVKNFIVWINGHVSYPTARHENPYYPIETYTRREGDCDDQAMLLITLCRILGIPSYLQIGCIYLPNNFDNDTFWNDHVFLTEKNIGWHGWAIVYIPPWGWLPVDLTYVLGSGGIPADPLNAIKHGAITIQNTIQYMNVTHTDYVASSLESRTFLTSNGFLVFSEDEMIEGTASASSSSSTVAFEPWVPLASAVVVVSAVVVSFLVFRHLRKRRGEAVPTPPENLQ